MMFNGHKHLKDDKTKGCSEEGRGWKMEQPMPSLRPSAGLLDMLAEVASQTLHSDPTVKTSPVKRKTVDRAPQRDHKEKPDQKDSSRRKKSEVDTLTAAKLRSLSLSQQLKLCSRLDGDEMRRTFTYTCLLEPDLCGQTFSSFGSEGRARQMMRTHLLEHLKNHGPDEPIRVSRKRRTPKAQNSKKKSNSKVKAAEPTKSSRLRYSELYDEVNNLPVSNKENKVDGAGEWRASSERAHQKLQSLNLLKVVEVPPVPPAVLPQQLQQTSQPVLQATPDSDEETLSCCSTGSRFDDLTPPGSPSRVDRPSVNGDSNDQGADSDKSIYTEHSYTSRGMENSSGNGNSDNARVYIKAEPVQSSKMDIPDVFICDNGLKRIPPVGREVDIKTESTTKTIKSEDLPVLCDNRLDSIGNDLNGRDCHELRWETTAVERDEFHQHKKPKGKAKFIGQSKAEKEMAIRLINAIKTKASPAGLQSLDTLECRICRPPRCFTAPTTLMSHYRSHAGIKPYECRICRAAFTRQHSLNYHMLIHSNQTRFTCHDCGRKFRHPSHFKEHRRRHTGESPFECSDCLLRFKTRNTYKRHLKTRHGKVLTTSGGLIILSEDEFKRVRTMPRSPLSNQSSRNGGLPGKAVPDVESEEEEEEEEDYSSGTEDRVEDNEVMMPPLKVEMIEDIAENIEDYVEEEIVPDTVLTEETKSGTLNFNDIVREALLQSDIAFSNTEEERNSNRNDTKASVSQNWNTKDIPSSHASAELSYPKAVVQMANSELVQQIQVYPMPMGHKRHVSKVQLAKDPPAKTSKKCVQSNDMNAENLATILSGQNTTAAIPQSLALLQSRYLVGSQPGLSVIGSDSQQATVLLLANAAGNQRLMSHQPPADTISLMLA